MEDTQRHFDDTSAHRDSQRHNNYDDTSTVHSNYSSHPPFSGPHSAGWQAARLSSQGYYQNQAQVRYLTALSPPTIDNIPSLFHSEHRVLHCCVMLTSSQTDMTTSNLSHCVIIHHSRSPQSPPSNNQFPTSVTFPWTIQLARTLSLLPLLCPPCTPTPPSLLT